MSNARQLANFIGKLSITPAGAVADVSQVHLAVFR